MNTTIKVLIISAFQLFSFSAFSQTVSDVSDLSQIRIATPDRGTVVAGDVRDVLANYAGLATALKTAIKTKLDGLDTLSAARYWKDLQDRNVTLPAASTTAINSRIDTFRQQKETALMAVRNSDPARAKAKMDELLAAGIPISQATQDAVNAKQPVQPTATPVPTPNDGL